MIKLLAAADLHLGRRTLLPPAEEDTELLSAETTWKRLVEEALQRGVDALLLVGDIIDEENRYLETFGPLESGLKRLTEAGIRVLMTAGNHDWNTLRDFVARLPGEAKEKIRILGQNGRWETYRLESESGGVDLAGWSFPGRHWEGNPLQDCDLTWSSDAPVIGLLHADAGAQESRYAPVSRDDFTGTADLWVLGHIHKPGLVREEAPEVWYPGSPHSFSSGETGVHGALLVEAGSKHDMRVSRVPLSPVRFETLTVELHSDEQVTLSQLQGEVYEQVRDFDTEHAEELEGVRHLGITLRLTGRARFEKPPEALARSEDAQEETRSFEYAGRSYYILAVENLVRPPIENLREMAEGKGPDAELAALILALRSGEAGGTLETGEAGETLETGEAGETGETPAAGGEFARQMLREVDEIRRSIEKHPTYMEISDTYPLPGNETGQAKILEEQAYRLLDTLLGQRS